MLHAYPARRMDDILGLLIAAFVLLATANAAAQSEASAPEIMAEMREVWQARAERMGACRIECAETSWCCGFYALITSGNAERLNAFKPHELLQLMEPPLFESSQTLTLVVEGTRMHKERFGDRAVDEHGRLDPMRIVEVCNGSLFLSLDQSIPDFSIATIHDGTPTQTRRDGTLISQWGVHQLDIPAFASMGLLYERFDVFPGLEDWELDAADDEESNLVTLCKSDRYQRHYCTFDRSRDYLLTKQWTVEGNDEIFTIEIEYSNETAATTEWVPTGWSVTHRNDSGNVLSTVSAEVSRFEVNVEPGSEEFAVRLPNSSRVQDNRPDSEGFDEEWGSSVYIIGHDGSIRILIGEERRKPPQEFFWPDCATR